MHASLDIPAITGKDICRFSFGSELEMMESCIFSRPHGDGYSSEPPALIKLHLLFIHPSVLPCFHTVCRPFSGKLPSRYHFIIPHTSHTECYLLGLLPHKKLTTRNVAFIITKPLTIQFAHYSYMIPNESPRTSSSEESDYKKCSNHITNSSQCRSIPTSKTVVVLKAASTICLITRKTTARSQGTRSPIVFDVLILIHLVILTKGLVTKLSLSVLIPLNEPSHPLRNKPNTRNAVFNP